MATTSGRESVVISDRLRREPYRFNFFQAVRLLEHVARARAQSGGGRRRPVGHDHSPDDEIARFGGLPSHTFPAAAISAIEYPAKQDDGSPLGPRPELTVTFMGMFGPHGVLPQHYTQLVIERLRRKDPALRRFLDLFNHRAVSLFYRAWEKYRFPFGYERVAFDGAAHDEDLFTRALYCLVGLGTPRLRAHLEVPDETFLYFAGYLAHQRPTAISLENMLHEYFGVPVEVLQFQGQWLWLDEPDQTRMPSAAEPLGRNNQLGVSAVAGERVWGVDSKFRLRLGPLDFRTFQRFTPRGDLLVPLCQLVRSYVGVEYDFDVQPVLIAQHVPGCRLGGDGEKASFLGWNTWLHSLPMPRDAEDAVFTSSGEPTRQQGQDPSGPPMDVETPPEMQTESETEMQTATHMET